MAAKHSKPDKKLNRKSDAERTQQLPTVRDGLRALDAAMQATEDDRYDDQDGTHKPGKRSKHRKK